MRRSSRYIHALTDWPKFHWDQDRLAGTLAAVRHQQGRLVGRMEALGLPLQQEATLETLTEETVKSSEIEGEKLDVAQVRSSIARRLGMDASGVDVVDRRVEGVVEMMLDATRNLAQPLLGPHSPEGVNQEEIARRRGTHDERNRNPGSAAG